MTTIQRITNILSDLRISYHLHYDCNMPEFVTVEAKVTDSITFADELTISGIGFESIGVNQGKTMTKVYL
jgi:hypothetical protein